MIRVKNHHPTLPFRGWVRTTSDEEMLPAGSWNSGARYIRGRKIGLNTHVVDVWCLLAPGESKSFDLGMAYEQVPVVSWPPDLVAHFGGSLTPSLDGQPMGVVSLTPDGASILAHFRKVTYEAVVDLWLWWYPDEPAWCHGEALVTAATRSDPKDYIPSIYLSWGDAHVTVLGRQDAYLWAVDSMAAGQAKAVPVTFTWPRHAKGTLDLSSAAVASQWQIGAVGIQQLLHDGNPLYGEGFTPTKMISQFGEAARRLHTWDVPLYGPAIKSTDSGDQEDQVFVRGEALLPGGEGAELVAWLSAIKLHAERPCNYVEPDGSPLEPARHVSPRLVFWNAMPHDYQSPPGNYVISPDRLGLSRNPTIEETRYRYGPDVEHWLCNTLVAACRLTGSPVAQRLLRNLCVVYLLQRTEDPSWSTTTEGIFLRGLGWEGIFVAHVWRDLEDRAMAQRVADRWRERCRRVILPRLAAKERDIWSTWNELSPAVPILPGWIPWHQAIMAYGLDLACRVVGPEEGCALALRGAKRVLEDVWQLEGERWVEYERLSLAGDRSRSGMFTASWFPCAVAVVRRYEPENAKAAAIWRQMLSDTANSADRSWLPPGVAP